jgi:hypothetical protein
VSDDKHQIYAYPDYVCLAILEYYAFEAGTNIKPEAVQNFRQLAGIALREFIYTQLVTVRLLGCRIAGAFFIMSYRQILVTAEPVRRRRLWADGQSAWR